MYCLNEKTLSCNSCNGDPAVVTTAVTIQPCCEDCGSSITASIDKTGKVHTYHNDYRNNIDSYSASYTVDHTKEMPVSKGFAGIVLSNNTITGFADSGSLCEIGEITEQDHERPNVKKVFANKRFVAVFTGTNAIHVDEFNFPKYYLEDWLKEHIDEFTTPYDLCKVLYTFIKEKTAITPIKNIEMIAGYHANDHKLYIDEAQINCKEWNIHEKQYYAKTVACNGVELYKVQFKENPDPFMTADIKKLKSTLENMESRLNYGDKYCTVSGPWQFEQISY